MSVKENYGPGYCLYRESQEILCGSIPLCRFAHVYDTEIFGVIAVLCAVCSYYMARFAKNVAICLNNEEVAIRLHTGLPFPSSFMQITKFQALRETWFKRQSAPIVKSESVKMRWMPRYQRIIGNEHDDALAKEACTIVTHNKEASIAQAKSRLEKRYNSSLVSFWSSQASKRYKDLYLKNKFPNSSRITLLPRCSLGTLFAERSGYGDFTSYLRRIHHSNSEIYCSCGLEKSSEHLFCYQLTRRVRRRLQGHLKHNMKYIKWLFDSTTGE